MTALSDALAAAQARALSALAKSYVTSSPEDDDAMESQKDLVRATLDEIGCRDSVEQDQWLAALDVLRATGANVPAEQRTNGAKQEEPASDAQWTLIRKLASERDGIAVPEGPLTNAQAHEVIDTIKAGTYDAAKWKGAILMAWDRTKGARSGKVLRCKECDAEFYVEPYRLRSTIPPRYCSLRCWHAERQAMANDYTAMRRVFNLAAKGERECRACGSREGVSAHHAIPRSIGTDESAVDLRNCLPLCWRCHQRWHTGTPIPRDVFTREEWDYLSGLRLLGREVSAYLDQHYPERAYGIRYER